MPLGETSVEAETKWPAIGVEITLCLFASWLFFKAAQVIADKRRDDGHDLSPRTHEAHSGRQRQGPTSTAPLDTRHIVAKVSSARPDAGRGQNCGLRAEKREDAARERCARNHAMQEMLEDREDELASAKRRIAKCEQALLAKEAENDELKRQLAQLARARESLPRERRPSAAAPMTSGRDGLSGMVQAHILKSAKSSPTSKSNLAAGKLRGSLASSGNLFLAASLSERAKERQPAAEREKAPATLAPVMRSMSGGGAGGGSATVSTMQTSGGSTKSSNGEPETDDRRVRGASSPLAGTRWSSFARSHFPNAWERCQVRVGTLSVP
jgi:hypothetical protein